MLSALKQPVYFIGIAPPQFLTTRISQLQWQLYQSLKATDTYPENAITKPLLPHVTLLNPPNLHGTLPQEIMPKVRQAAAPYLPLRLELSGIYFYDSRVCGIGIASLSIHSLYAQLVDLLPLREQAEQLRREYTPHVTLLQVKKPYKLDEKATTEIIKARLSLPIRFEVDSLTYFKRILPRVYKPKTIEK